MMKLNVTGVDSEINKLRKFRESLGFAAFDKKIMALSAELVSRTPIDTGRARGGWHITSGNGKAQIVNDVPYIEALNNGHSKQAPTHFVETVLMKHGIPLGMLVVTHN